MLARYIVLLHTNENTATGREFTQLAPAFDSKDEALDWIKAATVEAAEEESSPPDRVYSIVRESVMGIAPQIERAVTVSLDGELFAQRRGTPRTRKEATPPVEPTPEA